MRLRVILVLVLILQQLALPAAASSAAQAEECVATSCCQVVETTTCCGEAVREMRCGKTGGQCYCGVQSDDPDRAPEAPRPAERSELNPVFVASVGSTFDLPKQVKPKAPLASPQVSRSHNDTQAILCIWRT